MTESSEVKLHFLDYWRVIRVRMGLITLVFLLVMVTAGVTTYFLPRQYLAKVTMEVKPDESAKAIGVFGDGRGSHYDAQFVATQFQILRKSEILAPVIQQLDLIKFYSGEGRRLQQQEVMNILIGSLKLQEIRNTGLIEAGVLSTDPQEAADIANTLAVVYRNRRLEDLQKSLERGLAQFQDEVSKQRKVVEETATEAAHVRERDGIVDPDPESPNAPITNSDRNPIQAENAVHEQQLKVAQLRTMLARTDTMKPEEFQSILHTFNIEDASFLQNLAELQRVQVEEANLLHSGLGPKHPHILALQAKEKAHTEIINAALSSIKMAQATKLKVEEETLVKLEERLKEANELAIKNKNLSGPYVDAKTKYLEAKKILEAAEMHLSTARMEKGIDIDPVKIWERAERPLGPSEPPVTKYLVIAAVIGIIFGVGLAFFIEYLDTSVKTLDDVERFLQVAVLAVIPKGVPMLLKTKGDHPDAEAYRILRANIEFNKPSPDAKTITLISAGPGEGKSTTLNNLAYTCAKGGYNVLIVDADLRRPTQHNFFDTDKNFGLTDFLTGKATIDAVTRTTKIDNLSFIPSGELPTDAVGILNSQAMTGLIERVKNHYDLVFFDSPPILGVSDGSVLASEMDMTVMVIQHRRFPRAMLQRVKQAVQQVGGSMIGAVLNNVDSRHDDGYSYYSAYQDYYSTPRREARRPAATGNTRRPVATNAAPNRNGDAGSDY